MNTELLPWAKREGRKNEFSTKILLDIIKNLTDYLGSEPCRSSEMLFIGDKQNELDRPTSTYSAQSYFGMERGKQGLLRSILVLQ